MGVRALRGRYRVDRLGHGLSKILVGWATMHLARNNVPVCSLVLRKISKIGATRCQILKIKCTEFAFAIRPAVRA